MVPSQDAEITGIAVMLITLFGMKINHLTFFSAYHKTPEPGDRAWQ